MSSNELMDITIKNVLTDNIYNDLGFMLRNRLLILVEAQSTWTMNIIIRALLYLAQTYHGYFERTKQNLYKGKKVTMPKPELYVIYTGEKEKKPESISLTEEFFDGAESSLDVKIKVIYESDTNDIINQYIIFSKIYNEQKNLHGRTRTAIVETIRICKNRDILKEYLLSREKEVVSIMMSLYDEEEIMRSYIESERYEAAQEAEQKAQENAKKKAILMLKSEKLTFDEIKIFFPELTEENIREIEEEVFQLL